MKFLVVFALLACAAADVSELGYNYEHHHHHHHETPVAVPVQNEVYVQPEIHIDPVAPTYGYIPPVVQEPAPIQHAELSLPIQQEYAAPTVKYIPPVQQSVVAEPQYEQEQLSLPIAAPAVPLEIPQPAPVEIEHHADDGYHYRTVRRRVYRYRH